jgi:phosphoserine phosphatase
LLHIFDMDGTILHGATSATLLADALGIHPSVHELERALAADEITTGQFAEAIYDQWRRLDATGIRTLFDKAPWMDELSKVTADIQSLGEHSMVITMSPNFFADHLVDFGFDVIHASQFPPLPFVEPVDPRAILTVDDKPLLARARLAQLGLANEACVAYGDSSSDIALFGVIQRTVAVNASTSLEALAAASYRGRSMWDAYQLGRSLIADSSATQP